MVIAHVIILERIKSVLVAITESTMFVAVSFMLKLESKLKRFSGLPAKQSVP